jgi:hypothetical protein
MQQISVHGTLSPDSRHVFGVVNSMVEWRRSLYRILQHEQECGCGVGGSLSNEVDYAFESALLGRINGVAFSCVYKNAA